MKRRNEHSKKEASTSSSASREKTTTKGSQERPTTTSKRQNPKKQQQEALQIKNTGIGLSIDINKASETRNKKIVFDDDEVITQENPMDSQTVLERPKGINKGGHSSEDDDDLDDDMVEEVKGSSARDEILQQFKVEEKGALKVKKQKKRKDRRTAKEEDADEGDDDDDFDDDFFAQLETVKAEEEEDRKRLASKQKKKGKHTTFTFDDADHANPTFTQPKKVGHNIQVVVLPDVEETEIDDAMITTLPSSTLSQDALLYSRSFLPDGKDKGGKRKRNSPILPDTSWKRSRKMNVILSSTKGRSRRKTGRKGTGRPAPNFVTKAVK